MYSVYMLDNIYVIYVNIYTYVIYVYIHIYITMPENFHYLTKYPI